MNEFEIRRALAGVTPPSTGPDPDRLRAALIHADRMKSVRAALMVCAASLVVSLGVFMSQAGESSTPLDVVDTPETPVPDSDFPVLDDAFTETTTIPPTTAPLPDDPGHLDATPSTTAPPALIAATTTTVAVPEPAPTTTAKPTSPSTTSTVPSAFTAAALYGSCEEPIPYDEYSGKAAPGASITVSSPWSTTTNTTADDNGDWWVRVEFPSAPVGAPFAVNVSDGSTSVDLDFVRTA